MLILVYILNTQIWFINVFFFSLLLFYVVFVEVDFLEPVFRNRDIGVNAEPVHLYSLPGLTSLLLFNSFSWNFCHEYRACVMALGYLNPRGVGCYVYFYM